ncbi:MAG: ABC-F family ATP-binding cassette domain-containing protein [Actinobacteria bacterium]|nr:ABC-F family ATP-binding cassette domain-containing protein [Actinomycetota bacterium]MBW3651090.1 ABC-F family ATP-binding cassette domain-containing protein [Actinomycetota bacterium]
MILADLERVAARRPDRPLFEDLSVTVRTGDRLGIVGRNGSGKSTLLRVLAGVERPEEGAVRHGRDVRVGFLPQRGELPPGDVRSAVGAHWEAASILERLGMGALAGADIATLSGGQQKRVALARVLVDDVDLLVLDEPTNHLDLDAIAWLEDRLARFRGGVVVVTHDRHVLDRVSTRILELDRRGAYLHDGGYDGYLQARVDRVDKEASAEAVRRNLARQELAWLRRGAPARTRKPKARIAAATAIVEGRAPAPDRAGDLDLRGGGQWGATPRLGDKVVELHGLGHRFGPGTALFGGLDLDLGAGDRLGVVGPNGSGKSTLLEIIAGRLRPTEGRVETGPTVRIGYYDQTGRDLDGNQRVRGAVAGARGEPNWEQTRLMERFWFDADAQWAPIATLSGGEQRRLQLLLVLASLPNVLLLDEPSNDLDLDTLRALEDHLDAWPGTVVVVSHDRAFLERTVEDVLVLEPGQEPALAPGGYAGYAASRGSRSSTRTAPAMEGQRASAPAAAGSATATTTVDRAPRAAKVRSPSTVRRLLMLAERELAEAEAQRDRLVAELAGSGSHHTRISELSHSLAGAEARLATAEERWLALAEEMENG